MRIFILGGFLGSGKTSLLLRIANELSEKKGEKVAIIVNESGEIGVDGDTIKQKGYDSVVLPSGCICCTLAGSLQGALRNIASDIDPDDLIIEPTGLALPNKVKDLVHYACVGEDKDVVIGIVDIQRFDDLVKRKEEFFTRQMKHSDFILINKIDLDKGGKLDEVTGWLNARFPGKTVVPVSVKEGTNLEKVYELMME